MGILLGWLTLGWLRIVLIMVLVQLLDQARVVRAHVERRGLRLPDLRGGAVFLLSSVIRTCVQLIT